MIWGKVLLYQKGCMGHCPLKIFASEMCAQTDPPRSKHADLDRFLLIMSQSYEIAKKVFLTEQMQKFLAPFFRREGRPQLFYGRLLAPFTVHRLAKFG